MLYFKRMMVISLFAVRVILNVFGSEDFGIYNVVAGVVVLFFYKCCYAK